MSKVQNYDYFAFIIFIRGIAPIQNNVPLKNNDDMAKIDRKQITL